MRLRTLAVAVTGLALLASPAAQAKSVHSYPLPQGKHHCRSGYRKVVKKHKGRLAARCVKTKAKAAPVAPPVARRLLHAHLDPSFTQDPANPFSVDFSYSASASEEVFSEGRALVQPAPLPEGTLSFYLDGSLECAVNVGGANSSSQCPVALKSLGAHKAITTYTSGAESSTVTETEIISPVRTTSTLTAAYEESAESVWNPDKHAWLVGHLALYAATSPPSATNLTAPESFRSLNCDEEPSCVPILKEELVLEHAVLDPEGNASVPVYRTETSEVELGDGHLLVPAGEIEGGALHLRWTPFFNAGYEKSEAKTTLQFDPEVRTP